MTIPAQLVERINAFIVSHYEHGGLLAPPAEIAESCRHVASIWYWDHLSETERKGLDPDSVAAFAQRYGKHLGIFFLNEREG